MAIYSLMFMGPNGTAAEPCAELWAVGTAKGRALEVMFGASASTQPHRQLYRCASGEAGTGPIAPTHLLPMDPSDPDSNSLIEYWGWKVAPVPSSTGLLFRSGNTYSSQISVLFPRGLVYSSTNTLVIYNQSGATNLDVVAGFVIEE